VRVVRATAARGGLLRRRSDSGDDTGPFMGEATGDSHTAPRAWLLRCHADPGDAPIAPIATPPAECIAGNANTELFRRPSAGVTARGPVRGRDGCGVGLPASSVSTST
jgi:hypothetical protein